MYWLCADGDLFQLAWLEVLGPLKLLLTFCSPWHEQALMFCSLFSVAFNLCPWYCQHSDSSKTERSALAGSVQPECWMPSPPFISMSGGMAPVQSFLLSALYLLRRARDMDRCAKCQQYFCPVHCNLFLAFQWSGCCSFSTGLKFLQRYSGRQIVVHPVSLERRTSNFTVHHLSRSNILNQNNYLGCCTYCLQVITYSIIKLQILKFIYFYVEFILTLFIALSICGRGRQAHLQVS